MSLDTLQHQIIQCKQCPRLISWCQKVATQKRAMFKNEIYWGKPVPSFGDKKAEILIVGLAPAAHGANRTGRMFTGDRSGQWLYRALFTAKLSNQPTFQNINDGLVLYKTYVTAMVHCAPPQNKPSLQEKQNCFDYFVKELALLQNLKVIVTLGQIAWDGVWKALNTLEKKKNDTKPKFGHGATYDYNGYTVIGSYHPSQQNTFTGRLTEPMLDDIFVKAKTYL